jgi:hypothetical protein
MLNHSADAKKITLQIHGVYSVPVLFGVFQERFLRRDTRIVDKDVDLSKGIEVALTMTYIIRAADVYLAWANHLPALTNVVEEILRETNSGHRPSPWPLHSPNVEPSLLLCPEPLLSQFLRVRRVAYVLLSKDMIGIQYIR